MACTCCSHFHQVPNVSMNPTLEAIQEAINSTAKTILQVGSSPRGCQLSQLMIFGACRTSTEVTNPWLPAASALPCLVLSQLPLPLSCLNLSWLLPLKFRPHPIYGFHLPNQLHYFCLPLPLTCSLAPPFSLLISDLNQPIAHACPITSTISTISGFPLPPPLLTCASTFSFGPFRPPKSCAAGASRPAALPPSTT